MGLFLERFSSLLLGRSLTLRPPFSSGGTGTLLRDCRLLERARAALLRCFDLSFSTCMHTDPSRRTNSVSDEARDEREVQGLI